MSFSYFSRIHFCALRFRKSDLPCYFVCVFRYDITVINFEMSAKPECLDILYLIYRGNIVHLYTVNFINVGPRDRCTVKGHFWAINLHAVSYLWRLLRVTPHAHRSPQTL